jgi:diguanylate cyclase (GGDEF)-like protein
MIVLAIGWPLVVLGAAGELHPVQWVNLLGDFTICLLTLVGLWGVLRSAIPASAGLPIAVGLIGLFVGVVPDVLDEFFSMESLFLLWAENLGKLFGAGFVAYGTWRLLRLSDQEVEELEASSARFATLSITDPLTGLFNRGHLNDCLPKLLEQVEPTRPLSLLMLDIDDFKQHNDAFGHPEGDKVIATLADVIRNSIRETDVAFRYGGEEFAVILPGADLERGRIAAERILVAFSHRIFSPRPGANLHKTVSLGVARATESDTPAALIERADGALYVAKRAGKDQVISAASL